MHRTSCISLVHATLYAFLLIAVAADSLKPSVTVTVSMAVMITSVHSAVLVIEQ